MNHAAPPPTWKQQLASLLNRHWLVVLLLCFALVFGVGIWFVWTSKQAKDAIEGAPILTKKEVKKIEKKLEQETALRHHYQAAAEAAAYSATTATKRAKAHEQRADSLRKVAIDENAVGYHTATTGRMERYLSTYRPKTYGGADSIW